MQAHDIVNAKHAGVAHVEGEIIAYILLSRRTDALWMQRGKTPILALCEYRIRWTPNVRLQCEAIGMTPDVITVRMHSNWQIQIQMGRLIGVPDKGVDLFLRDPLDVLVKLKCVFGKITRL